MDVTRTYPRIFNVTYGSMATAAAQVPPCFPWFSFLTMSLVNTAESDSLLYKAQRPDGKALAYFIPSDIEVGSNATFAPKRQKVENEYALGRDWLTRTWGTRLLVGSFGTTASLNWCGARDAAGDIPAVAVFRAFYNTFYSKAVAPSLDGVFFDGPIVYPAGLNISRPYPNSSVGYGLNAAGGSTTNLILPAALPNTTDVIGRFVNFLNGANAGERRKVTTAGSTTSISWASALPTSLASASVSFFFISGYESVGATTFGANTATDPSANWTANEWSGGYVECNGAMRMVNTNTATTLTLYDNWIQGPTLANPPNGTIFEVHAAPNTNGGAALSAINSQDGATLYNLLNPFNNADYDGPTAKPQSSRSPRYAYQNLIRGRELITATRAMAAADGRSNWIVGGNGPLGLFAGNAQLEDYTFNEGCMIFAGGSGAVYNTVERVSVAHEMLSKAMYAGPTGAAVAMANVNTTTVALNGACYDYNRSVFAAAQLTDNWFAFKNGSGYSSIPYPVLNECKLPGGWGNPIDGTQSDNAAGKTYWRREFQNVLVIWNPSGSSVTVVEPGWKKFNDAALFPADQQSPAFNDGASAGGGGFALAADSGVVLIRE